MFGRATISRDPFEGAGAHRKRMRLRIEGAVAVTLAIAACGITAAVWVRTLAPVFERILS